MPPRAERLSHNDFSNMLGKKLLRGDFFDISYSPSSFPKVACVISKKKIKKAVERNRLRRRMYHLFYELDTVFPYTIVIYPKQEARYIAHDTLLEAFRSMFAKLT